MGNWTAIPCKAWQGKLNVHGYGLVRRKVRGVWQWRLTHRDAWEKAHGPIPEGMKVLHHCDNPPCYELMHLFLGTQTDNMADMDAKGRRARGDMLPHTWLTNEQVLEIRMRYAAGEVQQVLASEFVVSRSNIGLIVTGKNRKEAGGPITPGGKSRGALQSET